MQSLIKDALIGRAANAAVAAQTEILSSVFDMAGYDSIAFIAAFGTVTDNCVITLTVKSNPTSSSSGGTTEKVGTVITAATASNKVCAIEVLKPSQRYVFLSVTRTTQNAVLDAVIAIQMQSRSLPVTQTILDAILGGPNA